MKLPMWLFLGMASFLILGTVADSSEARKGKTSLRLVCMDAEAGEGGSVYQFIAVTKPFKITSSTPIKGPVQIIAHYCLVKARAGTPGSEEFDYNRMFECDEDTMVKLATKNVKLRKTSQIVTEVIYPDSDSQGHVALLYLNTSLGNKVTSFFQVRLLPPKDGLNTNAKTVYTCNRMTSP